MWYKFLKTANIDSSHIESNEEWLERHNIIREGDYFVFFHGSRAIFDELNANSLLEDCPERAKDFGDTNYLADKRFRLHIYKVLLKPEDIITGFWAKTNKKISVVPLSKAEQDYYNKIKKEGV